MYWVMYGEHITEIAESKLFPTQWKHIFSGCNASTLKSGVFGTPWKLRAPVSGY